MIALDTSIDRRGDRLFSGRSRDGAFGLDPGPYGRTFETGPRFAVESLFDSTPIPVTDAAHSVTGSSATEALHAALALVRPRAASLTDDDLSLLRERVCAAVDEMRANGLGPRQVVEAVKNLATESGLQWISIELIERLVSWCVARYDHGEISAQTGVDHPARPSQLANDHSIVD